MPIKLSLRIAKEIAYNKGGECLSEKYINGKSPMLWKCAIGHKWSTTLDSVKYKKTWCPWCAIENRRTRTIEDMRKFAQKKGGLCLATDYINRQDPLEWQCIKGHKWKASAKDIIKGTWCQQCRLLNIDIAKNLAQERGGECLSTEYVNINTPILWRCSRGHEWSAPLNGIKNKGRWCTLCAGNIPCGLMGAKEIAHSRGGMCLSNEYINLCVPMLWMCSKGHKWFASFNGIKHASHDFLKTPEHPRGLELDIYYPQYGFAIEVQGKQHEQYVKRFHKSKEDFEKQLMRDQIKRKLCDENRIVLIEIWYYEDPCIVIPEYLKELGLIGLID
ncbi:30216_t:CDS:2 [Gigaspora margarita]|uniref:30216_t:CDS:1 n=1 Tax=Gigaspora margarita TaxID=4874 RepID=A0ABM8VYQ6_GIGMA|nr:30216_t:CDS:2 [Gigaspora margarita]